MNCRVILILGGSGALGSDITDFLRMETDYLVYTLGRKESNDIKVDLEKSNIELTFSPDIIINCAGVVHNHIHASTFNQSLIDRDRKISSGIFQLLKNYPPKLFLNISSVSVYGVDKGLSYNENTPINPKSGYAKCKVESESLFSTLEHTKVVNLRLPLILTERKVGNIHKLNEFVKKFGLILFTNKKGLKSVALSTDIAKNIENFIHKTGYIQFQIRRSYIRNFG